MQTRTIALGLVAVLAAFAVAFGVGKAAGGKTATAGVRAVAIKVTSAPSVGSVEVGGTVPALKAKAKAKKKSPAKKKKKTTTTASTNSTTTAPSNSNSSPAPSTPSTPKPTPPKPEPKSKPADPGPAVTGGNEDG
jgi:hypothetical protein